MVKLIGLLLVLSSIVSLIAGTAISIKYGSNYEVTGNVVSNIMEQPDIELGFFDYMPAMMFSYAIVSLVMGIMFLVRF